MEVTRRPARRGYPEPSFEGLEALRAAPKDYHELAAALARPGRRSRAATGRYSTSAATSSRARASPAVTITVHHAKRDRDIEIDEEVPASVCSMGWTRNATRPLETRQAGDIAAQSPSATREPARRRKRSIRSRRS